MKTLTRYLETVLATAQAGLTYSKDPFDIERFIKLEAATAAFLAKAVDVPEQAVLSWICLDENYPTPKLDVRAIILDDLARVLLVKEASDGLWTLPGGWCDIGESASVAVTREVQEETGLIVSPVRFLALFDKLKHGHPPQLPHAHKAFFLCRATGGSLRQQTNETTAAGFFYTHCLPELSEHRVLKSQIEILCQRIESGNTETLFD
ncbi:DNA mismatch repair protein MutT [Deltaproteobacteria bacterium Smac51]|nr:DNA mismatch repair protein MutT [Deltaproteobacteria bacterium Smac51]